MTTRLYRLWQPGNPPNRIFLPNFWMKLVKPKYSRPPNHCQFLIHPEMTAHDVREYLKGIYKLPVRTVEVRIREGKPADDAVDPATHERYRHPDEKIAYVMFQRDVKFEFPDLFPEKKEDSLVTKRAKKKLNEEERQKRKDRHRPGIPSWFQF